MNRSKYLKQWRENNKLYQKNWEQNNKDKRKNINKRRRQKVKQWFEDYKKDLVCIKCGENENICLDFHHVNPNTKLKAVSTMVNECNAIDKIKEEINKCVVVCANCHRKIHADLISM